jgi:hypothetical protein
MFVADKKRPGVFILPLSYKSRAMSCNHLITGLLLEHTRFYCLPVRREIPLFNTEIIKTLVNY